MEEDIKLLEEYLDKQDRKFVSEYRLMILQAIENLIARNKKLEEHHKQFYSGELLTAKQGKYIEENYIPKSKVREKIEELKKEYQEKINKLMQEHEMLGDYASRLLIEEEQDRKKQKYNYERGE